jgi:hypothetical protein
MCFVQLAIGAACGGTRLTQASSEGPWRVPGGVPLVKSISRLAAMAAAASVFKREDESTSSPRAGRVWVRGVLVGLSNSLDFILSGADWTFYTD